jgi:hypothetical protein
VVTVRLLDASSGWQEPTCELPSWQAAYKGPFLQWIYEQFACLVRAILMMKTSGRRKTCSDQNDIVWTLFDPLSTTFIHF